MEWKKGNYNRLLLTFFALYLAALTWIILFKLTVPENIGMLARDRVLNLIPFYDIIAGKYFDKFDMVANIIVFIPFGIYTAVTLKEIPTKYQVITAFLLSLVYETLQFIFAIGVADITDVMMNTMGAYIGIIIYRYISSKLISEIKTRKFVTICSAVSALPLCTVLSVASVVRNVI